MALLTVRYLSQKDDERTSPAGNGKPPQKRQQKQTWI